MERTAIVPEAASAGALSAQLRRPLSQPAMAALPRLQASGERKERSFAGRIGSVRCGAAPFDERTNTTDDGLPGRVPDKAAEREPARRHRGFSV